MPLPNQQQPQKIILQNFLGHSNVSATSSNLRLAPANTFASELGVDVIRQPGVIKIGYKEGDAWTNAASGSTVVSKALQRIVNYYDGSNLSGYGIEAGTKLHKLTLTSTSVVNSGNFPLTFSGTLTRHGGHSTFVGDDVIIYNDNGTNKILVSWNDGTDGDIAICGLDGGSLNSDYFSDNAPGNVVLSRAPHPMVRADNGYYYVADANAIHKIDSSGASVAISLSAIDLPAGWFIADMVNHKGLCWILAIESFTYGGMTTGYSPKRTGVFVWNYINSRVEEFTGFVSGTPYVLENTAKVGKIFVSDNIVHTLTVSSNARTQLRRFTGTEFAIVHEESGSVLPSRGGVSNYRGHIMWVDAATGTMYTFGKLFDGLPERCNKIGVMTTANGTTSGAIGIDSDGELLISHSDTLISKINGVYTNSSITLPAIDLPKLSTITGITLYYTPFSDVTNSTLSINMYRGMSTSALSAAPQLTHSADGSRGWFYQQLGTEALTNINTLRLNLVWSLTSNAVGSFEIYRIEIDYIPTGKIK